MPDINPFEIKDYLDNARDKVTYSFRDSPVFDKYLQLIISPSMEIQEVLRRLMQDRSIDTAYGVQLDIIGNIVGQPRELIGTDLIEYFGYFGADGVKGYGTSSDLSIGGIYKGINSPTAGNVILTDGQYRIFIKAKILKNVTRATPDDVLTFITFVFSVDRAYIGNSSRGEATIVVPDSLNSFERRLLTHFTEAGGLKSYFVPKPLGVGYNFGTFKPDNFFAFSGIPNAKGYGSIANPTSGGYYASLFSVAE